MRTGSSPLSTPSLCAPPNRSARSCSASPPPSSTSPAGEGAAPPEVVEQAQKAGVRVAALLPRICTDREAPALFQELERLRAMGVTDALAGTLDSARRAAELGFTLRGTTVWGYSTARR